MTLNKQIQPVIFAGAGPGDPELLTIKAMRCLKEAEVIITDRLVSEVIIETYARPGALVLHAGKQRKKEGSTPQQVINELLVEYALQGKKVVRLKGGDVSVFSNLLDELQALRKWGIPYEIIPGITAASGAAACAGIPLTARNHAQGLRFLTLHQNEIISPAYWKELALTEDTLVFYMSGNTSEVLITRLLEQGIQADKYIAIIEQATTPMQKIVSVPIHTFKNGFGRPNYISPTLIIVGKVAGLHEQLKWMPEPVSTGELYFKPVSKNKQEEVRA